MNIYSKLTVLCLFLVITSGSILFIFTNRKFQKAFKEEIRASVRQQSNESIISIDRFIYSRLNDLQFAAKNPILRNPNVSQESMIRFLQDLSSTNDVFYSFSFFDMNRIRLADSKRLSLGKQHGYRLYWTELSEEKPLVMDVSKSESVGRVVMHFAQIIKDGSGESVGVLVGRVLIEELYNVLGNYSLTANQTRKLNVNLINNEGLILYSNTNPDGVLKERYADFNIINQQQTETDSSFFETEDKLYFIAQEKGYKNYKGNEWKLILSISKEDAFVPLAIIQRELIWIIVPVLIGSIILALVAANLFVKPIVKLSRAASEIGKGNFNVDLRVKSKDEVGNLARQLFKTSQILIKQIEKQKVLNRKLEDQKKEISSQKELLEHANIQVRDSIYYAERIQKSMLPDTSTIRRLLRDGMVIYMPKDIVSGDFYWFERVRKGRNEYLVVACADCTGHGVPGAIMSIMGSNQLTNIVYYQNNLDPQKILARLDKTIKFELYREELDAVKKDGMEIGVCVINLDEDILEFSGMGLPLYLIRDGKMKIYKGPRLMAGGTDGDEKEVEDQLNKDIIKLQKRDRIYMASDGYQDQFGGTEDKKFMGKNFRQLLLDTSGEKMSKQQEILIDTFKKWKKNYPQTDDVVILGFEV